MAQIFTIKRLLIRKFLPHSTALTWIAMIVISGISIATTASVEGKLLLSARPEVVASEATGQVLTELRKNWKSFVNDSDSYYREIDKLVSPVIAFDQISRGVMGKYAHRATDEQLKSFAKVFATSLVRFYGQTLLALDPGNLSLERVEDVPEAKLTDYEKRKIRSIPVNLKIKSGAKEYSISYSMIKSDGCWMAKNIIVEGVNIGIQFRNQFASAMGRSNDLNEVISNWMTLFNKSDDEGDV